jgi:hydroxymethylbilane synthase
MKLRFVTRGSALARQQTTSVIQALQKAFPELEYSQTIISTHGDRNLSQALPEIGGKGLFTQELEAEILAGGAEAAVHSLKDLPVDEPGELIIGSIPEREDPRDVLVSPRGYQINTLPRGAKIGTSSLRRAAQLRALRPDLEITSIRGNVDTRIRKAKEGEYDAIVLAAAGLTRLGKQEVIGEWLPFDIMLPAPGQAALAVQCRKNDDEVRRILSAIEDLPTRRCVQAERAFLSCLGEGCSLPVGAYARIAEDHSIYLQGLVASPDGRQILRLEGKGQEPHQLGKELAQQMRERGASELLG